jgi:hypothetical protein
MIRDSLGGVLTGGLLGNPIIGRFNLSIFRFIDIEIEKNNGAGGVGGYIPIDREEFTGKVILKINMFNKEYVKHYTFKDNKINIVISIVNMINKIKKYILNIKIRKPKVDNVQVKIHEKN